MRHKCIATGCGETRKLDASAATIATVKHHNLLNLNLTGPASCRAGSCVFPESDYCVLFFLKGFEWLLCAYIFFTLHISPTQNMYFVHFENVHKKSVHIFYVLLLYKVYFYC